MGISWRLISAFLVAFTALLVCPLSASATIYRCNKDPGVITLTNQKPTGKDCKKMVLPPPDKRQKRDMANANKNPTQASGGSSSSAGTNNGKDKSNTKKANYDQAVTERSRIINEELDLERSRLDAVNEKIRALENIPKLSAEQQKELLSYQKKQGLYQGNVDLLQKELKK